MRFPRLRTLLFATVALSLVAAACGGGDDDATSTPAATQAPTAMAQPTATTAPAPTATAVPVPTGDLVVLGASMGNSELIGRQGQTREYLDSMYDYMIGADDDGTLSTKKGLVTAWTLSADGKTHTLKTRKGVMFHNGREASAEDYRIQIERAMAEGSQFSSANNLRKGVATITAPDAQTLVVVLNDRDIWWHLQYASIMGQGGAPNMVIDGKYYQEVGEEGYNTKPIGSGPYKFKSIAVNDSVVMEAVNTHWLYGVPRMKTFTYRAVPEETTRLALVRGGQADIAPISRAGIKPTKAAGLRLVEKANSGVGSFRFESQFVKEYPGYGKNPLADQNVRAALGYYGIDRETIVATFLEGSGEPSIDYPSQPTDQAYTKQPVPAYDVNKAKQMLAAAGYPNGFAIDMVVYPWGQLAESQEIMEAIAVMWEKLGVKVSRVPMDFITFQGKLFAAKVDPQGAWTKPTVAGMWFLAGSPVAGAGAGTYHTPGGFVVNWGEDTSVLAKKWQASANAEEYKVNKDAYMKVAIERVGITGGGVAVFVTGLLWAAGPNVPQGWRIGAGRYQMNFQQVAAAKTLPFS